jgi:hypothetical protein
VYTVVPEEVAVRVAVVLLGRAVVMGVDRVVLGRAVFANVAALPVERVVLLGMTVVLEGMTALFVEIVVAEAVGVLTAQYDRVVAGLAMGV